MNEIHQRLMQASERVRAKQRFDRLLKNALITLQNERQNQREFKAILTKEAADVTTLESLSLTALFYTILGSREQQLEIERQEHLAAKLKHDKATKIVTEAQQHVHWLKEQILNLDDAQFNYEQLLLEKEQYLKHAKNPQAHMLISLSEQLTQLESNRKELQESINTGDKALQSLSTVHDYLGSAENWGTWDMMGGGTFATWTKHTYIDKARTYANIAQSQLMRFSEELSDVKEHLHISLDVFTGFSSFADYFFDGLIADWIVQNKIHNALSSTRLAMREVKNILQKCEQSLKKTQSTIATITSQRQEIIEKYDTPQ
jgi:hypothetical protein